MKKAIALTTLAIIITTIAAGLLFLNLVGRWIAGAKERANIESCRLNILTATKAKQFVPITQCRTIDINKLIPERQAAQVASLLKSCWYQFLDGTAEPWKGEWFDAISVCFVCAQFELPNKLKGKELKAALENIKYKDTTLWKEITKWPNQSGLAHLKENKEFLFLESYDFFEQRFNNTISGRAAIIVRSINRKRMRQLFDLGKPYIELIILGEDTIIDLLKEPGQELLKAQAEGKTIATPCDYLIYG